ncbi:RNA-binding domain-containing protein [Macrolepiota fuliginosa MF-IS2]|uniref:RNA-binding domain-containing protein n=1 Tax=Macrolepiota fuliginosa MF-IS2 TaxID=1400762 RepID=A0A9P5XSD9_9AGAR|nr:RNA-binding domain-containing protein [Macrolepiota fuliginosa MF-IS2]
MEEGTKSKKTVFVGGLGEDIDEAIIYETFSTFGDILEVQLPSAVVDPNRQNEPKHRGYAFVTFGSPIDAQDAIDNMDMNELKGKILKVNLARPMKGPVQPMGNRAVWESEEWLREHVKPLAQSGGVKGRQANQEQGTQPEEDGEDQQNNNVMEE